MPSTPYDLVRDDQDLRIPLHAEQAFFHGITFQAKLIGWQEVPRPNSRTEIVQAMRRIRYECKVQNLKKRKVTLQISVDGVKVSLKKKKRKKKQWANDVDDIELMSHPVYRIFYVSHDSSDLKIFSYIARDGSTDTFKCSVFKSNKKSQAMRIVRTIGQAFEVCHKFNLQKNSMENADDRSESQCELSDRCSAEHISDEDEPKKDPIPVTPEPTLKRPTHLDLMPVSNFSPTKKSPNGSNDDKSLCAPLSTAKEIQQLRDQLEQQALQTRQALAQLMLVREQLISETNARIEAQARTQQLLQQNRELLEHLATLGGYTYTENERTGLTSANIGLAPQSPVSLFGTDQGECGSPIRKSFALMTPNNNSMATISQQLNNLGTINKQLSTLSQQLSGLNQQSQNLQQFQNFGLANNLNALQQLSMNPVPNLNTIVNNNNSNNNNNKNINSSSTNVKTQENFLQTDLFQSNQELLNRLQNLSLGFSNNNNNINSNNLNNNSIINGNYSPFLYTNPSQILSNNNNVNTSNHQLNNNNLNLLSSPSSIVGNLTPSPIFNRSPYSSSPMLDNSLVMNMDRSLDRTPGIECSAENSHQFIRPISATPLSGSALTVLDPDGKIRATTPVSIAASELRLNAMPSSGSSSSIATTVGSGTIRKNDKHVTLTDFTLHVTDECGNITNSKKLASATPSVITRTTSEKVPNRSQLMSEVQRTAWARHTTK